MRLIDADAMRDDWLENGENEYVYDTNAVLDSIDSQPTVDAVEVVRCRDCKNWHKFESSLNGEIMCCTVQGCMNVQKKADDFCSYGERKDGDGNG